MHRLKGLLDEIYVGDCGLEVVRCFDGACSPLRCEGSWTGGPWCERAELGEPGTWTLEFNASHYARECEPLVREAREQGVAPHMLIRILPSLHRGAGVTELGLDFGVAFTELAARHGWAGLHMDDEMDDCPRRSWPEWLNWLAMMNALAEQLHSQGRLLTAAIQSLACAGHEDELPALLGRSAVDTWIEMDTYYGNLGRFLHQLRYYYGHAPLQQLGVGVYPTGYPNHTRAEVLARLCLVDRWPGLKLVSAFRLPFDNPHWGPLLRAWKRDDLDCDPEALRADWDQDDMYAAQVLDAHDEL